MQNETNRSLDHMLGFLEHPADDLFGGIKMRLVLYIQAKNNHEHTPLPDGMIWCHPKNRLSLEDQIRRNAPTWPLIPANLNHTTTRFPYAGLTWHFHFTTEQPVGIIQIP